MLTFLLNRFAQLVGDAVGALNSGWTAGRLEGWTTGKLDGWTAGPHESRTAGQLGGWTVGRLDGLSAGRQNGCHFWKLARKLRNPVWEIVSQLG